MYMNPEISYKNKDRACKTGSGSRRVVMTEIFEWQATDAFKLFVDVHHFSIFVRWVESSFFSVHIVHFCHPGGCENRNASLGLRYVSDTHPGISYHFSPFSRPMSRFFSASHCSNFKFCLDGRRYCSCEIASTSTRRLTTFWLLLADNEHGWYADEYFRFWFLHVQAQKGLFDKRLVYRGRRNTPDSQSHGSTTSSTRLLDYDDQSRSSISWHEYSRHVRTSYYPEIVFITVNCQTGNKTTQNHAIPCPPPPRTWEAHRQASNSRHRSLKPVINSETGPCHDREP